MKRKLVTYLSLLVLFSSLFIPTVNVVAETLTTGVPKGMEAKKIAETNESVFNKVPNTDTSHSLKDTNSIVSNGNTNPVEAENTESKETSFVSFFGIRDQNGKYTDTEPIVLETGSQSLIYTGFKLGDFTGAGKNIKLEMSIPNEFVKEVIASDTANQSSKEIKNDGTNTLVTYSFNQVTGGFTLDVPIKFINKDNVTPSGYQLLIKANIYEEGNNTPIDAQSITYQYKTKEMNVGKLVFNSTWTDTDGALVYGGEEDGNKPGYITSDISKTEKVNFSINNMTRLSEIGNREIEKYIVEDKIPDGAVFLIEDNPGWSYDETTRIARIEKTGTFQNTRYDYNSIYLRFPGAKINELITNTGVLTGIPKDKADYEDNFIGEDSLSIKLHTRKVQPATLDVRKVAFDNEINEDPTNPKDKENWEVRWQVGASTKSKASESYDIKLRDFGLDNRMKYTKINLPKTDNFKNPVTLKILKSGGQVEIVSNNLDLTEHDFDYKIPSELSVVEVILEGTLIDGGKGYDFNIYSKLKNPAEKHVKEGEEITYLRNFIQAEFSKSGVKVSDSASSFAVIKAMKEPLISLYKYQQGEKNLFLNDTTRFYLTLTSRNLGTKYNRESSALEDVTVVDLLPLGTEYVNKSAKISAILTTNKNDEIRKMNEPKIINDYKNTGRTALIWNFNDFNIEVPNGSTVGNSFLSIYFNVKTTKYSIEGKNVNESFLSFESSDGLRA